MPLFITSDSIGTGIRADLGNFVGQSVFVGQDATVISTDGTEVIRGNAWNQTAIIRGEVYGP